MDYLISNGKYNGKELHLESARATNQTGTIKSSGYIPFDLNIGSDRFGKFFKDDSIMLITEANINSLPFIQFLAPGLIMMAIIQNAFANATSSLMGAKMQGNIVDTLMPPLTSHELVFAYAAGGATRGLIVGIAVTVAMNPFTLLIPDNIFLILFHSIAASYMMAILGIISGIWAEKTEHMALITGFIVTPLSFLSGTFYSIERLPEFLQNLTMFNPFFYCIDGFRAGFIGYSDGPILQGVVVMCGVNIALWVLCHRLIASGYKLKE